MWISNIPNELFEIAASFKDTAFKIDSFVLLELNEFQLRICSKEESEVAIYIRFIIGNHPIFFFGEAYGGNGTDYEKWTNTEDVIKRFDKWYLEEIAPSFTDDWEFPTYKPLTKTK